MNENSNPTTPSGWVLLMAGAGVGIYGGIGAAVVQKLKGKNFSESWKAAEETVGNIMFSAARLGDKHNDKIIGAALTALTSVIVKDGSSFFHHDNSA